MRRANSTINFPSISLPVNNLFSPITSLLSHFQTTTTHFSAVLGSQHQSSTSTISSRVKSRRRLPNFKKFPKILALILLIIGIVFVIKGIYSTTKPANPTVKGVEDYTIAPPISTVVIDRELNFPLRDTDENEISSIKYYIEKAEIRDEIIVTGRRARAVEGRSYLILTLKITNNFNQAIEIDTRDYIRLLVNGNEAEKLAPDIHNDPVEVQAISVKNTRLGFSIDDDGSQLSLQVGEIDSDKETIDLNF